MAKKSQRPPANRGSLLARTRSKITGEPLNQPKKRISRYEKQQQQNHWLKIGMVALAVAVVAILGGAFLWTNVILPRQEVARVNNVGITREDYWKARSIDLWNQASFLQQYATMADSSMQSQLQQQAAQSLQQIPRVWGSSVVEDDTLSRMITDQLYLQALPAAGLEFAPGEVETYLLNQFADPSAPLLTPTPSPTLTPDRAAAATSTAAALNPAATPIAGTPVAGSPVAGASPVAGTPVAAAASPVASPVPVAPDEARRIAAANFAQLSTGDNNFFAAAHLTQADYERLYAAPALARQKISAQIRDEVGQSGEQVHARHILVETKDLADSLVSQLADGADFATLAEQNSVDEGTAVNGGDLGWFTREEMVAPFSEAAFALAPGEVSTPVQSEFGWHIIETLEHDADRPYTDAQINRITQQRESDWVAAQQATAQVSSSLAPTPTVAAGAFAPPSGAPLPPAPTEVPVASPAAGTPVAAIQAATPQAAAPIATSADAMAGHDMGSPAAEATP